jgi:prephenate dehydrogenase
MSKYNICICGGGNISHALAGILSNKGHNINIFTRQPDKWNKKITTFINVINYNINIFNYNRWISTYFI